MNAETITDKIQKQVRLTRKGYLIRNAQDLKFHHTKQMVYAKLEAVLENKGHKILKDYQVHSGHLIQVSRPDMVLIYNREIG